MAAPPCPCYGAAFIFPRLEHSYTQIHFRFCSPSNYHLHRRLIAPAARRSRRKWDSNAETFRTNFTFRDGDEDEEEEEEEDSSDSLDDIWIFKALKSYGLVFPAIYMSTLLATGPKAVLLAFAVPVVQAFISLAFEKLSGGTRKKKPKRKYRVKRKASPNTVKNDVMEEDMQVGSQDSRVKRVYESWMVADDGSVNKGGQDIQNFAGWDDLTGAETTKRPHRAERNPAEGNGKLRTEGGRSDRERNTREGDSRLSTEGRRSDTPLLLRLMIAIFPVLGSWSKLFW